MGERKQIRAMSIKLPMELYLKVKRAAEANHRSMSGQIAFFCDNAVAPKPTENDSVA